MESIYLDKTINSPRARIRRGKISHRSFMGAMIFVATVLALATAVSYGANSAAAKQTSTIPTSQLNKQGATLGDLQSTSNSSSTGVLQGSSDGLTSDINSYLTPGTSTYKSFSGSFGNLRYDLWNLVGIPTYLNWAPLAHKKSGELLVPTTDVTGHKGLFCNYNGITWGSNTKAGVEPYGATYRPDLASTNCDIPNITTQLVQDFANELIPQGITNGATTSAYDNSFFGLPSDIPTGVPGAAGTQGTVKGGRYTALELYGYNLKWTSYEGEWDQIDVDTSARLLSNFGIGDDIALGWSAIKNAVGAGISNAVDDITNGLKSGNPFQMVGGFLKSATCFVSFLWGGCGTTSSVLATLIDSSNANVFITSDWDRDSFLGTVYSATTLSQEQILQLLFYKTLFQVTNGDTNESGLPDPSVLENQITPTSAQLASTAPGAGGAWWTSSRVVNDVAAAEAAIKVDLSHTAISIPFDFSAATYPTAEAAYGNFKQAWATYINALNGLVAISKDTQIANKVQKLFTSVSSKTKAAANPDSIQNTLVCTPPDLDNANGSLNVADLGKISFVFENEFDDRGLQNTQWNISYTLNPNAPCANYLRSPIQNGLFGNGYQCALTPTSGLPKSDSSQGSAGQCNIPTDTRRSSFSTLSALFSQVNPVPAVAGFGLKLDSFFTKISNTFLNVSYNFGSVMQKTGINTLVEKLVTGLGKSIFFPLAIIVLAFAGLGILWRALRYKMYQKAVTDIILIFLTIVTAAIFFGAPKTIIDVSEFVPDWTAGAVATALAQTPTNSLCQATGQNVTVREMMCENWNAFYFEPYIYGQWGTGYANLAPSAMTECANGKGGVSDQTCLANRRIVGGPTYDPSTIASVDMGDGATIQNWGLYQLSTLFSGTTSTQYASTSPSTMSLNNTADNEIDPNIYRLVDLQAGPDNGYGTYPNYFKSWSGNVIGRLEVGGLSPIVSGLGMTVVAGYSMSLIVLTISFSFLLLICPFMFLYGLNPNGGRTKLKSYLFELISLTIKRVVLLVLLTLMMDILIAIINASGVSFFMYFVIAICVILAFRYYKKELLAWFSFTPEGSNFLSHDTSSFSESKNALNTIVPMPRGLTNWAYRARNELEWGAAGMVGGFAAGGASGAAEEGRRMYARMRQRMNYQRMRGIGGRAPGKLGYAQKAASAGMAAADAEAKANVKKVLGTDDVGSIDAEKFLAQGEEETKRMNERLNAMAESNEELERLNRESKQQQLEQFGGELDVGGFATRRRLRRTSKKIDKLDKRIKKSDQRSDLEIERDLEEQKTELKNRFDPAQDPNRARLFDPSPDITQENMERASLEEAAERDPKSQRIESDIVENKELLREQLRSKLAQSSQDILDGIYGTSRPESPQTDKLPNGEEVGDE